MASFERGDPHESYDPKMSSVGVDGAELRMFLGDAMNQKIPLICIPDPKMHKLIEQNPSH